jgi:hypothetical protein
MLDDISTRLKFSLNEGHVEFCLNINYWRKCVPYDESGMAD